MSGFRPGEEPPPVVLPAPATLSFTRAADAGGTDRDVLFGYQLFLGRDPETSFVIADAKTSPVGAFLRALMGSGEFQSAVLDKLAHGRGVPHETAAAGPSAAQLDWLFRFIRVPPRAEAALRAATGWAAWLRTLVAIPGFPSAPARGEAVVPEGVSPQAAQDGFVMIQIEQPKPGERLRPGGTVSGSGWVIAPSDVAEVAIELDGALLTHARYGLPRPDVARNFPHFRHVDHCGFSFSATVPAGVAQSGASTLDVRVRGQGGESGHKSVRLVLPEAVVPGAGSGGGVAGWPVRLGIDEAVVDAAAGGGRMLRLRGWAVSTAALQSVSVSLAGVALGEARHGVARPDIAASHPGYGNAASAGFVLLSPVGDAVAGGASFVRVQASDEAGHVRQAIVPVQVPAAGAGAGDAGASVVHGGEVAAAADLEERASLAGLRLEIDRPAVVEGVAAEPVRGALAIGGWALGRAGVDGVEAFAGALRLGSAHLGVRREDIGAAFPEYPGALLAGFALVVPPGVLAAGEHEIRLVVRSGTAELERCFRVTVEAAKAMPAEAMVRRALPPAEAAFGLGLLEGAGWRPAFTVSVAVAKGGRAVLAALEVTLESLAGQAYPAWRACVHVQDTSTLKLAQALVARLGQGGVLDGGRITVAMAGVVGAGVAAGRTAADGAFEDGALEDGAFAMMLRPGDRLGADALLGLALGSMTQRSARLFYADDVRLDRPAGHRAAFFKPDFSPDLLLGMNYIGRAWCARGDLLAEAGLRLEAMGRGADYDAVLRLAEAAARSGGVVHVTGALVECGASADATGVEAGSLAAALKRRGEMGTVEAGAAAGVWRVRRALPEAAMAVPAARGRKRARGRRGPVAGRVSIIMPTCGARELVRTAIRTIRETTASGRDVEIVLLDNTPATQGELRAWLRQAADVVVDMPAAFNWSAFNNAGARAASGAFLLFLNDDIEAVQPGWLEALLEHAQRPDVGVVGARLLYPDGKVQHAGMYLSGGHGRHAFRFDAADQPGPFGLAQVAREVIGVTGACQMVRAAVFARLGGYDEAHSVVNNDLDFCLRAREAGLRTVFTPHASLIHHELASRAALEDVYDDAAFRTQWGALFEHGDPYRNARLAADSDQYGVDAEPVRRLFAGRRGPAREAVRRILAVKLDHIGDFLTALPALRRLARLFPGARVDLLAAAASAELARGEACIGETIVFDFFHARSGDGQRGVGEVEFRALAARLAPQRYDIAVDLRMHPDTRVVLPHTGAGFLAGYDHDGRFGFLDTALVWEGDARLVGKRAHVSERLLQLVDATALACEPGAVAADAPAGQVRAAVAGAPVPGTLVPGAIAGLPEAFRARRLVCIHPGVGNLVRQWPAAHYASLIDMLAEAGLHAVLVGAPEEAAVAEAVLRLVRVEGVAESLVGRLKLGELGAVMRACVLFVGNNSGPKHLAASLGLPTVGIHSGVVDATEWGPLGPRAVALQRRMLCGPCYIEFASECPRGLACLTGLRPGEVFEVCRQMLG